MPCKTRNIVNIVAAKMVSEGLEATLAFESKALKRKRLTAIGFWTTLIIGFLFFLILAAAFTVRAICVRTKGMIDLNYDIEIDQPCVAENRMNPIDQDHGAL